MISFNAENGIVVDARNTLIKMPTTTDLERYTVALHHIAAIAMIIIELDFAQIKSFCRSRCVYDELFELGMLSNVTSVTVTCVLCRVARQRRL